jgi:hypothetical protein
VGLSTAFEEIGGFCSFACASAASIIILHSRDRMFKVKGPYSPEHKAYMALAGTIDEASKAFIALDESLK